MENMRNSRNFPASSGGNVTGRKGVYEKRETSRPHALDCVAGRAGGAGSPANQWLPEDRIALIGRDRDGADLASVADLYHYARRDAAERDAAALHHSFAAGETLVLVDVEVAAERGGQATAWRVAFYTPFFGARTRWGGVASVAKLRSAAEAAA